MKSIVPIVMAGVLGIYGLIISVIISTGSEAPPPPRGAQVPPTLSGGTRHTQRRHAGAAANAGQHPLRAPVLSAVAISAPELPQNKRSPHPVVRWSPADSSLVGRLQSTRRTSCSTGTRTWRRVWPAAWRASPPGWPLASSAMPASGGSSPGAPRRHRLDDQPSPAWHNAEVS